jgi:hypothetical protein
MMGDLAATIIAKSDQLNADDLISGPITVTVTAVTVNKNDDQPCSIFYEGDNGKPYKPNKGMRRLLMMAWNTDDSQVFIGRSMTLYRDPTVLWAGKPEGGIRISHLSHIDKPTTFAIMVKRGKREQITIEPLQTAKPIVQMSIQTAQQALMDAQSMNDLQTVWRNKAMAPFRDELADYLAERKAALSESPQTPSPDSPPVEGAETVSDANEGAEKQVGAAPSNKPLWMTLVDGLAMADNLPDVQTFAAMFDANEDEIPVDRLGEVQDAINAATARLTKGE